VYCPALIRILFNVKDGDFDFDKPTESGLVKGWHETGQAQSLDPAPAKRMVSGIDRMGLPS
jgi:hypothetical protein